MKGTLVKRDTGDWVVWWIDLTSKNGARILPLHQDDAAGLFIQDTDSKNEGKEVEFEIIEQFMPYDNFKPIHKFAKILKKDSLKDWDKQKLVKKWELSGLLDNIKGECSNTDMVKLLECKSTQLLDEPYISDDFQIGPDGAYEHTEEDELKNWDITLNDGLDNEPYISDDFQIGPDGAYEHTEEWNTSPREKASELIVDYQIKVKSLDYNEAKQCALVMVDEIKKILYDQDLMIRYDYWFEVKKEIEKL